jgi:hypothetical protein
LVARPPTIAEEEVVVVVDDDDFVDPRRAICGLGLGFILLEDVVLVAVLLNELGEICLVEVIFVVIAC